MLLRKISNLKDTLLFRLTILHAITFIILASAGFLIFYFRIYAITMENIDEELQADVEDYAEIMTESGVEGLWADISEEIASENPAEEFYRLLSYNGDILKTTDMSSWGSVDLHESLSELKANKTEPILATIRVPDQDYRARVVMAAMGSNMVLQFGETLDEAEEYLEIFRNLFTLLVAILIIVSTGIGWFLARRAVKDVDKVTQTAEEISMGAYDQRVEIKDQLKEVKRLGITFNRMLDRIQGLLRTMKEMNDNIAHDLRSPLARIRGIAEMTLTHDKSFTDYQEMAVSTMEECDTLIEMINTMLDITEAEAGVNKVKIESFDLVALILEARELFRPMAEEKQIHLKSDLPKTLPMNSDRKKMQRIVTNILENAIKYTPAKGVVEIEANAQDGHVHLFVKDTGIGIAGADLPHIFDRFYRCDQSRSEQGVGLGLSLVKAYTETMNGIIKVNSNINQGSIFSLSFAQ